MNVNQDKHETVDNNHNRDDIFGDFNPTSATDYNVDTIQKKVYDGTRRLKWRQ